MPAIQDPPRALDSVLLIDDSLTVRTYIACVLGDAGYHVTTVSDASAAVAALDSAVPDLVLLDMRLPGTDTVAVAHAIRERARGEHTVILIYSGKRILDVDELVTRYRADGYMYKTHEPEALLRDVEDAWRLHGPQART